MTAAEMLRVVRTALQAAYDYEYPLDSEPAQWMTEARRALVLSKRYLSRVDPPQAQDASR